MKEAFRHLPKILTEILGYQLDLISIITCGDNCCR